MKNKQKKLSYWWQCKECRTTASFEEVVLKRISSFIWDDLRPSWDQGLLKRDCPKCQQRTMRITYKFPRNNEDIIMVVRIVGLQNQEGYLSMMWETFSLNKPEERVFDFKYIIKKSAYGLNKPAIFTKGGLRELFKLYCQKAGVQSFP